MNRQFLIFLFLLLLLIIASAIYMQVQNPAIIPTATPLPSDCQVLIPNDAPDLQQMAALENVYEQFGSGESLFSSLTPTPVVLPGGCGTAPLK